MAEPMHARTPARHPATRRPRIPHPHLAPQPQRPAREPMREEQEEMPATPVHLPAEAAVKPPEPPPGPEDTGGWTAVDLPAIRPAVRPASRSRRGSSRPSPAERALRAALHAGLFVNLAVLLASRWLPALEGWSYGGDDFLLAATVLLSGYTLLAVGRLSRRDDPEG